MTELARNEMIDLLQMSVCKIKFTKMDGDLRVMEATLKPTEIPDGQVPPQQDSDSAWITVWSVKDEGWRSLSANEVLEFEPDLS